jgi:hypothetical protein
MLLTSTFVELRVVAGRRRTRAGLWTTEANSHIPCHAHATLFHGLVKSLSERHGRCMAWTQHVMCESSTAALCKSNGKDNLNPKRHGMAWKRHGMCELGLNVSTLKTEAACFSGALTSTSTTTRCHKTHTII